MTNDKLPETTQDRIKADADKWSDDQLRYVYAVEKLAYIEGATAWAGWYVKYTAIESEIHGVRVENERLKKSYQRMADALQRIIDHTEHEDYGLTNESCPVCIATQALQQFKDGKEVGNG